MRKVGAGRTEEIEKKPVPRQNPFSPLRHLTLSPVFVSILLAMGGPSPRLQRDPHCQAPEKVSVCLSPGPGSLLGWPREGFTTLSSQMVLNLGGHRHQKLSATLYVSGHPGILLDGVKCLTPRRFTTPASAKDRGPCDLPKTKERKL